MEKKKKIKKRILRGAVVCILIGILLLGFGIFLGGTPGVSIGTDGIRANNHQVRQILKKTRIEKFANIAVSIPYGDIEIIPSDGFYLEYNLEDASGKLQYEVQDGTLSVKQKKSGEEKIQLFGFQFSITPSEVKIYVPKDIDLHSAKLSSEEGTISLGSVKADVLAVNNKYGNVKLTQFEGKSLGITVKSGDIHLGTVKADQVQVVDDYGDITADTFSVGNSMLQTEEGEVKLSGIRDCGSLVIQSEYGDVILTSMDAQKKYGYDLNTQYGSIQIPEGEITETEDGAQYTTSQQKEQNIKVTCKEGDITIKEA
ncbi:MAG: DUF4097 family beta strand repeat-containing protein [Lachnospiraceae bacterium]|nr:DUF4097 family beta strand repeat-containing protein [Lachnospiraceae bacterium]